MKLSDRLYNIVLLNLGEIKILFWSLMGYLMLLIL